MELVTDFDYPGHSRPRCHSLPGRSGNRLLAALLAACRDRGIDVLVPARLVDVDVDGGAVRAGLVEYPDGRREEIPARAVLLATNGFGADADLVRRHIPQIAGATYHGSDASRGDALRIGTSRGADTAFLDAYQGHAALARRAATLVGWATVMHGAFLVNVDGRRFGDETEGYSEYAARELAQRGGEAVIVLDRRVHDACLAFDDFRETVQAGVLRWADSPGELAAAVDVDSAGLAGTLAEAAAAANGEAADPFGRTHWPAPLEPPYAAVRVVPAVFHTQGGLRVDGHARVLTGSGDTAAGGLYASGGAAMGISGHGAAGYLAGNGLLPALGLALLAAEDAAGTRR
jgi:fumarate reductase flavoprotein subunit